MKYTIALSLALFALTSCDEEKVADTKAKTADALQSAGDLAKDSAVKIVDAGKEAVKSAGEKLKPAVDAIKEKGTPAMEAFKGKLLGFSNMIRNMQGQAGDDPAKAQQMMDQLVAEVHKVPTDGVPADLAGAFRNYQTSMRKVMDFTRSVPSDPEAAKRWQMDHADTLLQLEKDYDAAQTALKAAAEQYGLTGLDFGANE